MPQDKKLTPAKKAARTKGPEGRSRAALKAEATRTAKKPYQVILDAIAALASSVEELRQDVARIDVTTRETQTKVEYLCEHFLGVDDQRALRRASG